MASQRPFRSFQGLAKGPKKGHLGSKIDFSEIDPEGGLGAWGAQKIHFYGGLSLFRPSFRLKRASQRPFRSLQRGRIRVIFGSKID